MLIIGLVTTITGIWRIVIVAVVASITIIDIGVCPGQWPVSVVNRERSRRPAGICGVAILAISANPD